MENKKVFGRVSRQIFNFVSFAKFSLGAIAIFLGSQGEARSTRIGNVVECRQENNNGNGLYIKRESCNTYYGCSGQQYTECRFTAYFTAEGDKGNKSVIQSLRENSALPSNADRFTNIDVDDLGGVQFHGSTYNMGTTSFFQFRPTDNEGQFKLYVRSESGATYRDDFKQTIFNYTYNCSYVP